MVDRIKLPFMESILPEGIPLSYVILIRGGLGMGKTFFNQLIAANMSKNARVLYVCFDDDPASVMDSVVRLGGNEENLLMINGFSSQVQSKGVTDVISEYNIDSLNSSILNVARKFNIKLIIIDSINDYLINMDPRDMIKFIKGMKALSREKGLLSIITAHTTTDDITNLLDTIEYTFDGVMEVDVDSTLQQIGLSIRRFRVKRMKGVPSSINWVHYDIINDEITIVDVSKLMTLLRGEK
ncbi:ATPase [Thermocladium modestius]|uniref:ATPase n=1 Tax=Thermocladium modestius TaxID=62609 RepID=A0A830GVQ5_9CREN|nr:RAD55 family ATPase [Thermocladium modestius]GGP20526.1 ATPase [Thermocladium modestius]